MGNNNSSSHSQGKPPGDMGSSGIKKCYYELLGVQSTASAEDIRKAYRQRALQLHPDKNQHRVAEATEEFSAVQNAYQTLSDAQERAWYDRHRDAILGNRVDEDDAPDVDDLMKYFRPDSYSGFEDGPKGFFTVYRSVFEDIEDFEAEDGEGGGNGQTKRGEGYTSFGSKNTPYEPSLAGFYAKWLGFQSARKFSYADKYQEQCSDNRRYRRAVAKENQKARDQQRKEYSETVRELASFCQKRDPRYTAYRQQKTKEREEAEKIRKAELKARKSRQVDNYIEPEWSQTVDEQKLADLLDEFGLSDSDSQSQEIFQCNVCRKNFRNKMQWINHSKSKKHKSELLKLGISPDDLEHYEDDEGERELDEPKELDGYSGSDSSDSVADYVSDDSGQDTSKPAVRREEEQPKVAAKERKPRRKTKDQSAAARDHRCNVCLRTFDSRNKLFRHLEEDDDGDHRRAGKNNKKRK